MGARQDHVPVSDEEKQHFLRLLANGRSIVEAAGNESMRRKLYRRINPEESCYDEDFARAWDETIRIHRRDYLVHVAQCRAIDGWEEPVWHKGEMVGTIHRHDSRLLEFLIKQADPSFRENQKVELTGKDGGPIAIAHEQRLTLAHLFAFAESIPGLGGAAGGELPDARPVLPAPDDGGAAAGALPAGSES
jgi:hypothetical protein